MSNTSQPHVIIGGGLAAGKAAETLRREGFDGRVVVVAEEAHRPYERPSLSKGVLTGDEIDEAIYVHSADWYRNHGIELRTGVRAIAVDPETRMVVLSDDTDVQYTKLLLATGARARRLPVPGTGLDGVYYLRSKDDADALKTVLSGGDRRVLMVGGGWIGLEVAAAARGYDNEVGVIDANPVPLYGALGLELGGVFADLHAEHGVTMLMHRTVTEIVGESGDVTAVRTDHGDELPADVVVVGIGTVPRTGLAEDAGLAVDDGIVVDASLRASDENIYAAGDVARWHHPLYGRSMRVEHWANALAQGPAAARSMLGHSVSYDEVPYFYTDQYDLGMEFVGDLMGDVNGERYDAVSLRGDIDARVFTAFWTCHDRLVAGMNVNVWDGVAELEQLVRSGRALPADKLSAADVPLAEV